MLPDDLKRLAREMYDEVINHKRVEAIDRYCAAGYVDHNAPAATNGTLAEIKAAFAEWVRVFPDFSVTVHDQIAEGDRVVTRLRARGTHSATFNHVEATGRTVEWDGIDILRIVDGRISERWGVFDDLSLMDQIRDDEAE
jgi:predicted ester cyclase